MPHVAYENAVLIVEVTNTGIVVRNKQSGERPIEMLSVKISLFGAGFNVTALNGDFAPTTPSQGLPTVLLVRKETVEVVKEQ